MESGTSGSVGRNSDHYTTEARALGMKILMETCGGVSQSLLDSTLKTVDSLVSVSVAASCLSLARKSDVFLKSRNEGSKH
jgi:hypothetical protein